MSRGEAKRGFIWEVCFRRNLVAGAGPDEGPESTPSGPLAQAMICWVFRDKRLLPD
jgi:hypothetical protein